MATSIQSSTIGGLYAGVEGEVQGFPLKHTEVWAGIAGNLSRTRVRQTFENPFTQPLEATYVFPLPDEAAVDRMDIRIGDRRLSGKIKKREEAQQIYQKAKQEGRTAGLLEQERDNIFTQSLANIKPGEQIDVTIHYTESLKFERGDYEFVFPMVVGPRYIPGTPIVPGKPDSDRVPDASRISPPVMPPNTRSGQDIGVTVEIEAGLSVSELRSPSHEIQIEHEGPMVRVHLAETDSIPNKDFILRYRVAGHHTQATVLTQADDRGGHFAFYLLPALTYNPEHILPKDIVFLVDTSGSQKGDPLLKSQDLMRRFINGLNPDDTFSIIDFADTAKQLSISPLPNRPENRTKAIDYINKLQAWGGTRMLNGIRAVVNFPESQEGRLRSVVMLTDGYIGNENEIFAEVQGKLKPGNRLHAFGVGSSVNRFLINRLAEVGRGISRVVRPDEPTEKVAEQFFHQINNPVLANLEVIWQGTGEAPEIYPTAIPDLFSAQPLVLCGRKRDRAAGNLQVIGTTAGGDRYETILPIHFEEEGNVAVAQLWGRSRIKHLTNKMFDCEKKSVVEAVTQIALSYQLLSQYTAFVAVSEDVRVDSQGNRISVEVPVEMPQGVSYEGIFGVGEMDLLVGEFRGTQAFPARRRGKSVHQFPKGKSFQESVQSFSLKSPNLEFLDSVQSRLMRRTPSIKQGNKLNRKPHSGVEIITITGLDEVAASALEKYLQQLQIKANDNGKISLELLIQNGRVVQVIFDDEASTLEDSKVIQLIKRSLFQWQSLIETGKIQLVLKIKG